MAFIVKKKIHGKEYFYLRESRREKGKVKAITLGYLGKTREEAEEKMREFKNKQENKKIMTKEIKQVVADNKKMTEKNKLTQTASVGDNNKNFSLPRKSEDFQGPKNQTFLRKEKQNISGKNSRDNQNKQVQKETKLTIDELASFCKRKGFVFPSSLIYGGLAGFWDLGPLGVELMNNIKKEFWKFFVQEKENMIGIEASIISHPRIWKASGHTANFNDLMIYCKKHKKSFRVDHLVQEILGINAEGKNKDEILKVINENRKEFEDEGYDLEKDIEVSSLMFKTKVGSINSEDAYLRPETAQGMFADFRLVQETSRKQLPFGIVQIGRCFRNEIAPRDFLFRSREFHIGEFEFFIHPEEKRCELLDAEHLGVKLKLLTAENQEQLLCKEVGKKPAELKETTIGRMLQQKKLDEWHAYWLAEQILWFNKLGLGDGIKVREHMKSELSHYSSATFDMDYEYPFGSKEIAGNANRGQYDLNQHIKESGEKLDLFDEKTKKRVIPRVIEPTFGMERVFLALLCKAYLFDSVRQNIVLKIPAFLAPIKAAIFPIVKVDEKIVKMAEDCYKELRKEWNVVYDDSGSVGRRYSRADENGTPMCVTCDEQSLKDNTVTIRWRDNAEQVRIKVAELNEVMRRVIDGEDLFRFGRKVNTRVK